jgi:putative tryptophan/tyrosine transport system substrate-binding protein
MQLIGLAVILAFGLLAAPLAVKAQQGSKAARIGFLGVGSADSLGKLRLEELRDGLRARGHVEGQTFVLVVRWAEGRAERLPQLAAEFVALGVDVIVTHGSGIPAAKKATDAIPIIMARHDDADEHGLVASLARPGGNVTGLSFQARDLSGKWVQLLKEVRPRMTRAAILSNRGQSDSGQMRAAEAAIRSLQLSAQVLEVPGPADFSAAFASAKRQKAEGAVVLGSVIFSLNAARLADLASTNQLPTIYYHRRFAEAGGLLAYGPKESDFDYRRVGVFVDKILKGAKPADLPVEQPTNFELVINLKTAKALGLTIPQSLLLRADQVIE